MLDPDQAAPEIAAPAAASNARRRPLHIRILRLMAIAVAVYFSAAILLLVFQRHLIYFPSRVYDGVPSDIGLSFEEVRFSTADGVVLAGWYVPRDNSKATMLFFHGNGGNISHRLHAIDVLHGLGYSIFIIDYRGYGQSQGKPFEEGLYRDAEAAWQYLIQTRGESPRRIVLMGESLGGAVAVELAARHAPAALVVESTFTTLAEVAKVHYPYFPVGLILSEKYDSIGRIGRVRRPVLILHGSEDELVPLALGKALFAAANEPKRFIETPGGHNEAGFTYTPDYAEMVGRFIDQALGLHP
jgi:hypothetical protein